MLVWCWRSKQHWFQSCVCWIVLPCLMIRGPVRDAIFGEMIPYSAGIDLRRQNLTTVDVRFRRLQPIPHWRNKNIYNDRRRVTLGIQINQKELTKSFMMISNWKTLVFMVYTTIFQRFNPLSPHDALKHHFASLKNDLISSNWGF